MERLKVCRICGQPMQRDPAEPHPSSVTTRGLCGGTDLSLSLAEEES